ncbi:unnamed protein product [Caenorhabditis sp. 36 PRJEB53466]|nr:unnamed protein product [Caenorhabditis sp. 36 PRJEB53466]
MSTRYTRSTDDVIAGATISGVVSIGFILIVTVLVGCYRIPAMRGSFGVLTANQNFSQLIGCVTVLIFYSFGLVLDFGVLVLNSGYFGNCSALILTVITGNFLLISLNRTCAICFPIYYKLFFSHNMVLVLVIICWLIPVSISSYYIFGLSCRLSFSQFGWLFTSDLTIKSCGTSFKTFLLSSQSALSFVILAADLSTLCLLLIKRNELSSWSKEARKTERNFALQVLLQGLVFNFHSIWISNAINWLPGEITEWKLFFTTTFSSNLLMIFDPAVIIIFNREFRTWLFTSRATVFVATISASAGRSNKKTFTVQQQHPSQSMFMASSLLITRMRLLLLEIFLLHTCTVSGGSMQTTSLIAMMNQKRADWAKSNNVANMWKLKNDKDLEAKAKQIFEETECDGMRPGDNYRVFPFLAESYGDRFESVLFATLTELETSAFKRGVRMLKKMEKSTGFVLELSNALQKKVGCTRAQCRGLMRDPLDQKTEIPLAYALLCVIGPETRLLADYQREPEFAWYGTRKGEPGTKCGEDGVGDKHGLCVAK